MRNRLPLIIGAVLGVLTVVFVQMYIQQHEKILKRQLLKGQEPVPVLIAAKDVSRDTILKDDMVKMENRPAYAIQPHAIMDPGEAIGLVVLVPIYAGEQVTDSKLARPDTVEALSMKTPPGRRAVTIAVDNISGVGGLVKPGDFVDLLGTFALPNPGGDKAAVTVTLLQRIEVLAVGAKFSAAAEEGNENASAGPANNLTLALTPQQAQLILFAREAQGQLQLALRSRSDTNALTDLSPTTQETLLGVILGPKMLEMAKQAPVVKKAPEHTVEVYRGLEREVVVLPEMAPEPKEESPEKL